MNSRKIFRLAAILFAISFLSDASNPSAAAQSRSDPPKTDAAEVLPFQARPLISFYRALYDLESGRRTRPGVIIQLGDSHTAGDKFSGVLRKLFQDRFGYSGRGMMPAGKPFRYYDPTQVKVEQSGPWTVANSRIGASSGVFGISGFRTSGSDKACTMSLTSIGKRGFDRVEIDFLGRADGGSVNIEIDDSMHLDFSTRDKEGRIRRVALRTPGPASRLVLSLKGDGPVDLLSWTVENDHPGIVLDSHGVVGATVNVMDRWDTDTMAWELTNREPILIIVAYGGNEGYDDRLDPAVYERKFRRHLSFLKAAAPTASILVLGPGDGNRLPGYCQDKKNKKKTFSCRPLKESEIADYLDMITRKDPGLCRWHPPPKLAMVRSVQQKVANEEGYAFWDWLPIMGGECGIHQWTTADPPLAAGDHLHLKAAGYARSAEILFKDIMYYYHLYRDARIRQEQGDRS